MLAFLTALHLGDGGCSYRLSVADIASGAEFTGASAPVGILATATAYAGYGLVEVVRAA